MKMDLKNEDYLGDGVYCGHDGYHIWIWTSNGIDQLEPIALEQAVLNNLNAYAIRLYIPRLPKPSQDE